MLNFYLPATSFGGGLPDFGFQELALIGWILLAIFDRLSGRLRHRIRRTWVFFVGVYTFIVIISVTWSKETYTPSTIRDLFYHIFVPFLFAYFSTYYSCIDRCRSIFTKHAVYVSMVLAFIGLTQLVLHFGENVDVMRSSATLGNPNALAIFLVMNIPLVFFGMNQKVLARKTGYIAFVVIIAGVLSTISRKGILTAALSLFIFMLLAKNYKALILAILLCLPLLAITLTLTPAAERFEGDKIGEQIRGKWNMTVAGWDMFRKNTVIGLGYKGYYNEFGKYFKLSGRRKYDAHNNFITALANYGLIGFIPFICIFLIPLAQGAKFILKSQHAVTSVTRIKYITGLAVLLPFIVNAWLAGELMYITSITIVLYSLIAMFCIPMASTAPRAPTTTGASP